MAMWFRLRLMWLLQHHVQPSPVDFQSQAIPVPSSIACDVSSRAVN